MVNSVTLRLSKGVELLRWFKLFKGLKGLKVPIAIGKGFPKAWEGDWFECHSGKSCAIDCVLGFYSESHW